MEAELRAQVTALQAAVEEKDKDMRTVMATVDRLQKTPNEPRQSGSIAGLCFVQRFFRLALVFCFV